MFNNQLESEENSFVKFNNQLNINNNNNNNVNNTNNNINDNNNNELSTISNNNTTNENNHNHHNNNSSNNDDLSEKPGKELELTLVNSNLNPNAPEFFPNFCSNAGVDVNDGENGENCFNNTAGATDQDYEFDQSYELMHNKFNVENPDSGGNNTGGVNLCGELAGGERLDGGLADDISAITNAGGFYDPAMECGVDDYQPPYSGKQHHHNHQQHQQQPPFEGGYGCPYGQSGFNTPPPPMCGNENYGGYGNPPVYFNGYPGFGPPPMGGCPFYYGPNMYFSPPPLGELFMPQPYAPGGVPGMPYLHYGAGMLKCNEYFDPHAPHHDYSEYTKNLDSQLKILYQRGMVKKSKAIEIRSPDSVPKKKSSSGAATPKPSRDQLKDQQKRQRLRKHQKQLLDAHESHFTESDTKKSVSALELELSFKPKNSDSYHPIAGLLMMPKRKFCAFGNTTLSRIQGSLNLHDGSSATIRDNPASNESLLSGGRPPQHGGSLKECLDGKSSFYKHCSMRELKVDYEKTPITAATLMALVEQTESLSSSDIKDKPEKPIEPKPEKPIEKPAELLKPTEKNSEQKPAAKKSAPVEVSRIQALKNAFEQKIQADGQQASASRRIGNFKTLKKDSSAANNPSVSILCSKNASKGRDIKNSAAASTSTAATAKTKTPPALSAVPEAVDVKDISDTDNLESESSQQLRQIHESIDDRIKLALFNQSKKSEELTNCVELLKSMNKIELSDSLLELSKRIAEKLDINHDAIMAANEKEHQQNSEETASTSHQPTKLNGLVEMKAMLNQSDNDFIQALAACGSGASAASSSTAGAEASHTGALVSSKSSIQQPSSSQTRSKRSQVKIFGSLPFLKNRQKSNVGYVEKKLNDVKKAKELERKRDNIKKLEAKKLDKIESQEKKLQAKAQKDEEERQKELEKEREKELEKEREKVREIEKLREKKLKVAEEKPKKNSTSSVASSVRRIFVPRFESKASAANASTSTASSSTATTKKSTTERAGEIKKPSHTTHPRTVVSGSHNSSFSPTRKSSLSHLTRKQPSTARSPPTTSHHENSKESLKVPLTSRYTTVSSASSNNEPPCVSRTTFTRSTLASMHTHAEDKLYSTASGTSKTQRRVDQYMSVKTTTITATGTSKFLLGVDSTTQDIDGLQKFVESQQKKEKSKSTSSGSSGLKMPQPINLRRASKTDDSKSRHASNYFPNQNETTQDYAMAIKLMHTKQQDKKSTSSSSAGSTSQSHQQQSQPQEKQESGSVVVEQLFKNSTVLGELRNGTTSTTNAGSLDPSKLEPSVLQTQFTSSDFSPTNSNNHNITTPKTPHNNIPNSIPNSARTSKQQQNSPPTSSRNTKLPRGTVASQLRKIEIQKRQNLFPDDAQTTNSNAAEHHHNIKMSQYLFK